MAILDCRTPYTGGRLCFFVTNTLVTIFGITLIVLGPLTLNSDLFNRYLVGVLKQVEVATSGVSLYTVLQALMVGVILVGVVVLVVSILGWFAIFLKENSWLMMFLATMLFLLLVQITAFALVVVFKSALAEVLKTNMHAIVASNYDGDYGTSDITTGWNYIFSKFQCCGVNAYTDMHSASNWNRTLDYSGTIVTMETPFYCCQLSGSYPDVTLPTDYACAVTPTGTNSNYATGCYWAMEHALHSHSPAVLALAALGAVFELAVVVAGFVVFCCRPSNPKDTKTDDDKKPSPAQKPTKIWMP